MTDHGRGNRSKADELRQEVGWLIERIQHLALDEAPPAGLAGIAAGLVYVGYQIGRVADALEER